MKNNIDRDTLKKLIENTTDENERQSFKERLKFNKASTTINLDDRIKDIATNILKGEISAREAERRYNIDRETIKRKINQLVKEENILLKEYVEYLNKSGKDYGGINFKGLIIQMICDNLSQSEIATNYGIPARTVSRELEKIGKSNLEEDKTLYKIAKKYADRKMKREIITDDELKKYRIILEELFENIEIINLDAESKDDIEIHNLEQFLEQVKSYEQKGYTLLQISEELGVGVSTIRRRKLRLEELEVKKDIIQREEGRA